jgi:mono/diheme cytochrome c family protein
MKPRHNRPVRRNTRAIPLVTGLAVLGASACAQVGGVTISPEASLQMHEHFGDLLEIRRALVLGDLEGVRRPASRLAEHEPHPGLPAGSRRHVETMQSQAARLAAATDLTIAAYASAAVAASCGACHAENDVGPEFIIGEPPDRPGMTTHMIRYSWALNRFWQGLIAPSDEAWLSGSDLTAETRIAPEEFARRGLDPEDAATLYAEVREIGERARSATAPAARQAILAEFWVSCAVCHQMVALDGT